MRIAQKYARQESREPLEHIRYEAREAKGHIRLEAPEARELVWHEVLKDSFPLIENILRTGAERKR